MASHDQVVDFLTQSSPLLSETAALLGQASLPAVGLQATDPARDANAGKFKADGVKVAEQVTEQAPIASVAAPDLALAAPDLTVAANA
jgi:hypothetical protein